MAASPTSNPNRKGSAMAMRSPLKIVIIVLLVLVVAILLKLVLNYFLMAFPRGSGVLVTISKETTYITEPLRPDGYPDYIAVLNQRGSKGVTPENNAVVPVFRAMGPKMVARGFSRPGFRDARHRVGPRHGRSSVPP